MKILVCISLEIKPGNAHAAKIAMENKFKKIEQWLATQSKKTSYPLGTGAKSEAYWENGGWFKDMYLWTKHDNLNNGYVFAGKGFGLEGGRKSAGLTHTIDTDGIARVFDSMPQNMGKLFLMATQFIDVASKYIGLFDDAQDLNFKIPYIEKMPWLNNIVNSKDTTWHGRDFSTSGRYFQVDIYSHDTTELKKRGWDEGYK